ncbi:retrovirus-related pol polyprotein from transposon TNT 1-94 [Tanacetum coccineum]
MRMRQYICHTDHNLWDIIVNGDLEDEATPSGEQSSPHVPKTAKQMGARRNLTHEETKSNGQDGRVVVQDVRGRYNANNQGNPFQRNTTRGNVVAGNVGGQNRGGIINPGPAKPIKCYNCNGLGHIARECPRPKRLQDSDYFKDKMLLMQSPENGAVLDEEQSLFLARGRGGNRLSTLMMMWRKSPRMIWHSMWTMSLKLMNVMHSNSDVDRYVEDNEEHVVQSNVSSVRNDALMLILDEMHEQGIQSRLANKPSQILMISDLMNLRDIRNMGQGI